MVQGGLPPRLASSNLSCHHSLDHLRLHPHLFTAIVLTWVQYRLGLFIYPVHDILPQQNPITGPIPGDSSQRPAAVPLNLPFRDLHKMLPKSYDRVSEMTKFILQLFIARARMGLLQGKGENDVDSAMETIEKDAI
jgi:hypothetical protein